MSYGIRMKIRNRHQLKTKDVIEIAEQLRTQFHQTFFDKTTSVETGFLDGFNVVIINNDIDFFRIDVKIFFTLPAITKYHIRSHRVVVDMGAIRFITNGADVMAAGIVEADESIQNQDVVWVCDETHHKPLAIGVALRTGEQMRAEKTGKAVQNYHYVGDELWNLIKMQGTV